MPPDVSSAAGHPDPEAAEVVRLGDDDRLVPPPLMTPPFREDGPGLMRDLAALLLDRHLRRLARMRHPVDLRLGRLLARLDSTGGMVALGFARLGDYVLERLGLSARRARALVSMARRLDPLPRIAAAFEAGEITRSKVALLVRVATTGTEAEWLERARVSTVRRLDRAVRDALAAEAGAGAVRSRAAAGDDNLIPGQGDAITADDEDASGEWIDLSIPVRLRPVWDQAIELARRASGAPDPAWACAEVIAADFLSGVPDLAVLLARAINRGVDAAVDPVVEARAPRDGASHLSMQEGTELFEEVLDALENEIGSRRWLPPVEGLEVRLPRTTDPQPDDSPRAIDGRLRELVRLRQNIAWHQGRLLRLFVGRRLYAELGFPSFSRYCSESAGIGVRRAWELVGLERRLWLLPRVAAEYRSGALSWVRAATIARVATEATEEAWLRLAGSVTVRRLEEEVALAERTEESRLAGALPIGTPPVGLARPPGLDADGRVQLLAPAGRARTADGGATPNGATDSAHGDRVQMSVDRSGSTRLRFWAPVDVAALWHQAIRVARARLAQPSGDSRATPPADWQAVELLLTSFIDAWGIRTDPAWRRNHRIFERDGWRCRVPGCSSRRNLQVHHVVFRSQGGGEGDDNLAVLCAAHHLRGIHQDRLRCHALPDGLLAWEFAPDPDDGFLARFVEDVTWSAARAADRC